MSVAVQVGSRGPCPWQEGWHQRTLRSLPTQTVIPSVLAWDTNGNKTQDSASIVSLVLNCHLRNRASSHPDHTTQVFKEQQTFPGEGRKAGPAALGGISLRPRPLQVSKGRGKDTQKASPIPHQLPKGKKRDLLYKGAVPEAPKEAISGALQVGQELAQGSAARSGTGSWGHKYPWPSPSKSLTSP